MVPPTVAAELQRTPLYEEHEALGARLVPFAGWKMPVQYVGIVKEHQAVRERAGVFDVCHMGELEARGPGATEALDRVVTNDVAGLPVGKALYTVACNERGTILDDFLVYRRGEEDFLIVVNASNRPKMAAHFATHLEGRCEHEDASDRTGLIALQGPRAADILRAAGAGDAALGLRPFWLATDTVGGVRCLVARTGYTGEDGFELFCAADEARTLWRALIEAGEPHGLQPAGLGARDTLRLEARLSLYGNDIDETTNPLEAGLGWVVKLDKGDFIGREALRRVKEQGPERALVGFEMTGRGIARHGYPIVDEGGRPIGVVTSGAPGPTVGKNIGLGYVPRNTSGVGTRIGVEIRGKVVDAVIVPTPFYKRRK
ncbi:MAG: glycine cleavage system aminomethyltransferase GcvT [Myxococcota bacterium]